MSVLDTMLSRLTSNYNVDSDSNINKLFQIIAAEIDELNTAINDVQAIRNIDQASDNSLDKIGRNVLQSRNALTDVKYRESIKTKIQSLLSNGEIGVLNEVAKVLIGENFKSISEAWNNSNYGNEDAAIIVEFDPTDLSIPFGLKNVVAPGVKVNLQGNIIDDIIGITEEFTTAKILSPITGAYIIGQGTNLVQG